ncbi:hypothetical protein D0T49_07000 [Paludibacter sp. 221]|uniref:peroxiredoxin family protein n=1 Tax=Paludibacter sp. 221 TaxID=2302939 RepID=UPI0013D6E458|nr:redoxin domain-containing protein [Paludibacter sp. 221]NDV46792.1 hypothetical protein [Paludibacter sp. 221]
MKRSRYVLFSLSVFLMALSSVRAQTIQLSLSSEAGREYVLYFYHGQKTDSVLGGRIDAKGEAVLQIPQSYSGYKGAGTLAFKGGKGGGIEMIINNENFSLSANPQDGVSFKNSVENNYLINFFSGRTSPVSGNGLYASRYLKLMQYNEELKQKRTPVYQLRSYLRKELDVEALYTSAMWNDVISGTFELYSNKKDFGIDMTEVLKRTRDKAVFDALSDDLITICFQFGWEAAQDTIVSYLINSNRIKHPSGKVYAAFEQHKVRPGFKAPHLDVDGKKIAPKNVLLVFHETGCENCEIQMQELVKHYAEIKKKGYEIITVSSDLDEHIFESSSAPFPWKTKICDYEGFDGVNFKTYGIVGTPTMYLIDKDGVVKERSARLVDLNLLSVNK